MVAALHSDFRVAPGRLAGVPLVSVHGALDAFTAPELRERLAALPDDDGAPDVVVDLSHTTSIDGTGCAVLLSAHRRARARGGRLVVVATHPALSAVFAVMGVGDLLPLVATREQAREWVGGSG